MDEREENVGLVGGRERRSNKTLKIVMAFVVAFVGVAAVVIGVATIGKTSTQHTDVHSKTQFTIQQNDVDQDRLLNDENYRNEVVQMILDRVPLIDGHNDFAFAIRMHVGEEISQLDLRSDLISQWGSFTDIPSLLKGRVGGQFWSVYIGCNAQYKDAVQIALEQVAIIKSMIRRVPDVFEFVTEAKNIQVAHSRGRIASMLGMEGGHMIGESFGVLGQFYDLGIRYLTLTHNCNTVWAESCCDSNSPTPVTGLTEWGKEVVLELNKLGIFADISHVSPNTMADVLDTSIAPVIFSHSSALALCDHPRNVPDDILRRMKDNGGVVMVNFSPDFVSCSSSATLSQIADHVDYIKNVAGVDHVGIGGDFDGFGGHPIGLEDVSKYPDLFSELLKRGWGVNELEKLAGLNLIRAFAEMEEVRDRMANQLPNDKPVGEPLPDKTCVS